MGLMSVSDRGPRPRIDPHGIAMPAGAIPVIENCEANFRFWVEISYSALVGE